MASSISIESLLREKKYPFIVSFVILIGCVSVILFTTTPRYIYPSSDTDIQTNRHSISDSKQSNYSSSSSSSPPPLSISNPPPLPISNPSPPPAPLDDVDKASDVATVADTRTDTDDDQHRQSEEISWNSDNPNWEWEICNMSRASDYVPCLDNMKAIKSLKSRRHMEHRERHCPQPSLRCLVPLPKGYKIPITWPMSRDMIWYDNVPHPKLVDYKKGQNWVMRSGNHFVFPGGGTQFKEGVAKYIEFIGKTFSSIKWGKHTRVILDVGCGVASFGGYLLDKDVIAMSFAPKDEHEAQIQFALERGIPAILSVIGTQRLNFPDNAYDLIHCARCRVHWDADGGKPLLELNRILRPGGLFVWSATPVYRDDTRDLNVWNAMVAVTKSLCWKQVAKTVDSSGIGLVVYQKPVSNSCYESRKEKTLPLCDEKERQNISWYLPLGSCLPKLSSREVNWPAPWPERLTSKPQSLALESTAAEIYYEDTKHWSVLVSEVYLDGLAINWSSIRNVMDMNAGYGGFAAALVDHPIWVMNVVPINTPDTLAVIFDRGLIGTYHDWCEPFNTYPRTYDLLHANYLFGNLTKRCEIVDVAVEIDRILRPGGWLLVQDNMEMVTKLTHLLASLHWETTFYQGHFLLGKKGFWRPRKRN